MNGGLGLRNTALIIPAAKWASAASVAADISPFTSSLAGAPRLTCVVDRDQAHRAMAAAGVLVARTDAGPLDLSDLLRGQVRRHQGVPPPTSRSRFHRHALPRHSPAADTRLRHMWRSFDFNFGQPSVVLVRVGDWLRWLSYHPRPPPRPPRSVITTLPEASRTSRTPS